MGCQMVNGGFDGMDDRRKAKQSGFGVEKGANATEKQVLRAGGVARSN